MSNYFWMFIIVSALTIAGIMILGFMVMRYYWGERGTPPPNAAERRRLREEREANSVK